MYIQCSLALGRGVWGSSDTVWKRYTDSTNHRGITVIFEAVSLHSPQCNINSMFKNSRVCIWLQLYYARARTLMSWPRLFYYIWEVHGYYRSTGRIYAAKSSPGLFLKLVYSLSFPSPTPTPCTWSHEPPSGNPAHGPELYLGNPEVYIHAYLGLLYVCVLWLFTPWQALKKRWIQLYQTH